MFANYLVAALRNLRSQKLFAAINVLGLAIGLAACSLIIIFVQHEFSYDQQFTNIDRLYRIEATGNIPGQPANATSQFFGPSYDLLRGDFEEIEYVARLQNRGGTVVQGDQGTPEQFSYVDPEFLQMFDLPAVEGDYRTALAAPGSIVLTREMAEKHLGAGPWTGRTLVINDVIEREHRVTAVIEDLPGNTHFEINYLLPIDRQIYEQEANGGPTALDRWNGLPFFVYVQLKEGRTADQLAVGLNDWVDRYFPEQIQALVGIKGSELFTPRLMRVRDLHMYSPALFDMKPRGSIAVISGFAGVAMLILAIACINFTNLAAAVSTLRAREVGIRKVMGAKRGQLFVQFEMESLLSAALALVLAMVLLFFLLPVFSSYTGRELDASLFAEPLVIAAVLALTVVAGLLAGLHPALVLSGFRPVQVLKSTRASTGGRNLVRTLLVLFQFSVSAALIIVTLLVYVQTDYSRNLNMGYDNEQILTVGGLGDDQVTPETLRDQVLRMPGVTRASLTSFLPGDFRNTGLSLRVPGIEDRVIIFYRAVYPEFFAQFDVQPLAGRLLSDEFETDRTIFISDPNDLREQTLNVVVNEMAARRLGFDTPEAAIGQVYYRGRENQIVSTIVGVVPNVHFGSPRIELDAEIYMYIPGDINNLLVTYDAGRFQSLRTEVDDLAQRLYPRVQLTTAHLRDNIAQQFQEEEVQGTLLAAFSGLAVVIACMGLFGLASFTVNRRTREIGIRKVMGARVRDIVFLLTSQFLRPVVIANVVAWPFCWYAVNEWLQTFNHRIDLLPWFALTCAVAVLATVLLALSTVASHALRVARANPVTALRYE